MPREYQLILPPSHHPDEDWKRAVSDTEGVRLIDDSTLATDEDDYRVTGPLIDAEVFFAQTNEWKRELTWCGDKATVPADFELGDESHPAWWALSRLAHRLDARIEDDEGQAYDTTTGEPLRTATGATSR